MHPEVAQIFADYAEQELLPLLTFLIPFLQQAANLIFLFGVGAFMWEGARLLKAYRLTNLTPPRQQLRAFMWLRDNLDDWSFPIYKFKMDP